MNVAPTRNRANGARKLHDSAETSSARFAFRPFGREKRDLEFEFTTDDRPQLITEILAACVFHPDGSSLDIEQAWNLSVSRRIEYLLCVAMGGRESGFTLTLQCPWESCRQLLEIDLPLGDVLALQRRAEDRKLMEWQDGGTILRLRRPTGCDQREWNANAFTDVANAQSAIVRSLVVGRKEAVEESSANLIEALDAHLEEFDPLVAFSVRVACAQCGAETNYPLDLDALALDQLERIQRQLLQEVHRLASRYHWSESEVLSLTPERRLRYLRLVEEEVAS